MTSEDLLDQRVHPLGPDSRAICDSRGITRRGAGVGDKIRYIYDFGDDWEHDVILEKILPADARVTGAYATHGRQHIDFDTTQEHAAPNTTSDLAFRGVLQGRSTAVWKGNIIVDPGAQKTDAFQESRNLLISKRAHADAIPGLEIQANDVRCTHAAAIAQVDPDQLFYLRSHGLDDAIAKRLVIEGFLAALVERFEEGPVRDVLAQALERRLGLVLNG